MCLKCFTSSLIPGNSSLAVLSYWLCCAEDRNTEQFSVLLKSTQDGAFTDYTRFCSSLCKNLLDYCTSGLLNTCEMLPYILTVAVGSPLTHLCWEIKQLFWLKIWPQSYKKGICFGSFGQFLSQSNDSSETWPNQSYGAWPSKRTIQERSVQKTPERYLPERRDHIVLLQHLFIFT